MTLMSKVTHITCHETFVFLNESLKVVWLIFQLTAMFVLSMSAFTATCFSMNVTKSSMIELYCQTAYALKQQDLLRLSTTL